ncbi:MAG: multiprotein bridging factor aMBF1 [Candidatus Aenigmatarchaeota archaeon]
MECTICGKETAKIFKIELDGNIIEVCENCKSYGKIVKIEEKKIKIIKPVNVNFFENFEIVENYGEIIRNRRIELNLTIRDLAKKIGVKESYLSKIEKGEIYPDKKTLEKMEKLLKIKLKDKEKEFNLEKESRKEEKLTIADVVEIK